MLYKSIYISCIVTIYLQNIKLKSFYCPTFPKTCHLLGGSSLKLVVGTSNPFTSCMQVLSLMQNNGLFSDAQLLLFNREKKKNYLHPK